MYQSSRCLSTKQLPALRRDLEVFLHGNEYSYARFLRRKVFFDKLPDSILKRKDAARRLRAFEVAIDILKKSSDFTSRLGKRKEDEFEIVGFSACGSEIKIHVREEIDARKNKKLQFISSFSSKSV